MTHAFVTIIADVPVKDIAALRTSIEALGNPAIPKIAAALDSSFGVQCRAGLHCAPRMHAALGTLPRGGTVRFSCGWSTTIADIDRAIEAVAAIAGA